MTINDTLGDDIQEIEQFLQAWCREFTRAVEMFSGIEATVACSVTTPESEQIAGPGAYLWRKQAFESSSSFTTWIGAPESTWSILGNAPATDANEAKSTYLEMNRPGPARRRHRRQHGLAPAH